MKYFSGLYDKNGSEIRLKDILHNPLMNDYWRVEYKESKWVVCMISNTGEYNLNAPIAQMDLKNVCEYMTIKSDQNEDIEFVWGVRASDNDCSFEKAEMNSLNDLDIYYCKSSQKYSIFVETIYDFIGGRSGETQYMIHMLNAFTQWMEDNNLDTNKKLSLHDIFTKGLNINSEFDSLEQLYSTLKFLVAGFAYSGSV